MISAIHTAAGNDVQRIVVGDDITMVSKALDRLSAPRAHDYGARIPAVLVGAGNSLPLMDKWTPGARL